MSVKISYKGVNDPRKAINDMCAYMGLKRMKIVIRALRQAQTVADIDNIDMACSFGGVQGEPVRRLIAYVCGEAVLDQWQRSVLGSKEPLTLAAKPV